MARLDNKILIITGGTQGIGEATALYAAENGAAGIIICGRQEEKGAAVAAAVQKLGCECEYVRADLSVVEDCRNVVKRCDERFGRVDGLANIAADTRRMDFDDCTPEFWDYQYALNVRGPFLLMQDSVRIMKREKIPGSIVNISSVASFCGLPTLAAYSSTKGAINALTKNTANSLRQFRIRVNAITLGWTDTPGEHHIQTKEDGRPENWLEIAEKISPWGRIIKCDETARLVGYLLSDESGIMSGSLVDLAHAVVGVFPQDT